MREKNRSTIIFEDNHLIALNKINGTLSQGDETGDPSLMDEAKHYIKWQYQKPGDVFLGSFHRLDRPASGVVIFARTSKALTRMNDLMRERKIAKTYYALVEGRPKKDTEQLTHYLSKDRLRNVSKAYEVPKKERKESTLSYELVGYIDHCSLLKIDLETGRSHQIRAQLSAIGYPIIGDLKSGGKIPYNKGGIGLHCYSMGFVHPVTKQNVSIIAKPPKNRIWSQFEQLISTPL